MPQPPTWSEARYQTAGVSKEREFNNLGLCHCEAVGRSNLRPAQGGLRRFARNDMHNLINSHSLTPDNGQSPAKLLLAHFDRLISRAGDIPRLNKLILQLAGRGREP